ncbi:hypothetical protein HOL21_04685 [Candidatus Woesearchaeota archaeon]|jgi:hypothetical protein|nr:hypothetical protein [Candidatus Woesearchaeota archaeon]MBT5397483.1 hypothetical protein [Candidatus Woesearchaeota archaeon]MBT5924618.1 hypothetical protein [Candidatus Woesearchaeota archaeon]MBT6367944.1 hypothetical protein [Candidatus Woesearchaeota archaeon]MBT7763168.1 hypothetical protein [Candidatus Woesearchaeota archaeon]
MEQDELQQLREKYKAKIKEEFGEAPVKGVEVSSREYTEFKQELYPTHYSFYEKMCNFSEKLLKLKVNPKKAEKYQKSIKTCHLNVTPSGVTSLAILTGILLIVFGTLFLAGLPVLFGSEPLLILILFGLIAGMVSIPLLQRVPHFMANTWRIKASSQMVQSVFYMVTFMRHTSNLERAIKFAADHLEPPISLDFRKILWDVETQKYSTIRDSANEYLESWKEWDKEFVEAFHLIESSLFESAEERRLALLDKSLDVILTGTYENMLHYAHNLKSPMTMLHMLGIILPILGLVILPLVVSFMSSGSNPIIISLYIALLYNISIPTSVYFLGKTILSKRPAGYGSTDISEQKGFKKLRNVNIPLGKKFSIGINPAFFAITLFCVAALIGFSPIILHNLGTADFEIIPGKDIKMLDYVCRPCEEGMPANSCGIECDEDKKVGPYGMGASLLSLLIIAGLGVSIGLYFSLRSKNVIKIRQKTKELEDEFSSALFQLGNRLGDGIPAEIAFAKVAVTMQGTTSGDFFTVTERNMTSLGMGLEQAIFDSKVGALVNFPSKVIESSMKVLIESAKKGPLIAARALLSMSRYIKEIHRVEERLKDLMSDVISSMKSQIKFLTPAIAGIVIGITSMISGILTKLTARLGSITSGGDGISETGELLSIFGIGIPTFYFQIVVGIYIVQIIYILTVLSNGIENGSDKLGERFMLGKNLISSTLLYCFLAGVVMILFNLFSSSILTGALT